jgi:hypothetical protein
MADYHARRSASGPLRLAVDRPAVGVRVHPVRDRRDCKQSTICRHGAERRFASTDQLPSGWESGCGRRCVYRRFGGRTTCGIPSVVFVLPR